MCLWYGTKTVKLYRKGDTVNQVDFLVAVAEVQGRVGGYVTPKRMMDRWGIPRATFYRYMKLAINSGYAIKVGHGKYALLRSDAMMVLGMCLITPLEFLEGTANV